MFCDRLRSINLNKCSRCVRLLSTASKRTHTRPVTPESVQWFPGHMRKGMDEIDKRVSMVDVIIEVHDARIPFSGRSNFLQRFGQVRPHILIFNKMDLAEKIADLATFRAQVLQQSASDGQNVVGLYVAQLNSPEKQRRLLQRIINELPNLIQKMDASFMSGAEFSSIDGTVVSRSPTLMSMAVGIPNCGKSTLINALRSIGLSGSSQAARVGRHAGQTRAVGQPILISRINSSVFGGLSQTGVQEDLRIMMLDTPGILDPVGRSLTEHLSLCLCGAINLDVVDRELLVDYLLFWWNHRGRTEYVSVLDLPGPTDNVVEVLARVCARQSFFHTLSPRGFNWQPPDEETDDYQSARVIPDFHRATEYILKLFGKGAFGRTTFLPTDEEAASQYFVLTRK